MYLLNLLTKFNCGESSLSEKYFITVLILNLTSCSLTYALLILYVSNWEPHKFSVVSFEAKPTIAPFPSISFCLLITWETRASPLNFGSSTLSTYTSYQLMFLTTSLLHSLSSIIFSYQLIHRKLIVSNCDYYAHSLRHDGMISEFGWKYLNQRPVA